MESIFQLTENGLDESAYKIFTEELKESYGKIRVFIHPTASPYTKDYQDEKAINPLNFLQSVLTNPVLKSVPFIILNDVHRWAQFNRFFENLVLTRNVFVIDTRRSDPTPVYGWEYVSILLKNLGVKEIILSGMYLKNNAIPSIKNRYYGEIAGCVEYAREKFIEYGFGVKISIFTNPDKREIYNKKSLVT